MNAKLSSVNISPVHGEVRITIAFVGAGSLTLGLRRIKVLATNRRWPLGQTVLFCNREYWA